MDTEKLVNEIRLLAQLADSAGMQWKQAVIVNDEETGDIEHSFPDNEREVIVFLNGHVDSTDHEGRNDGGWGIRLGFFDHDKRCWRVGGRPENFVTHWMEVPAPPKREK